MLNWIKNVFQPTVQPANYLQAATLHGRPLKMNSHDTIQEKVQEEPPALRVAKLIMVTANNNNKFYEMREQADGTFTVNYGRVGTAGTSTCYPIHYWDQKLREKTRKGYKDQTHLFAVEAIGENRLESINCQAVKNLLETLIRAAKQSIRRNYYVTADEVSKRQVAEAQALIDKLVQLISLKMDVTEFNQHLLELYQVIPRRMKDVRKHLVKKPTNDKALATLKDKLGKEQDTLDVMRGQVELKEQEKSQTEQSPIDFLSAMGLEIELVKDQTAIKMIKQMMGGSAKKFKRAFRIVNARTQKTFDALISKAENKKVALFWHGSRNENWLSIIKSGLVLRPANAVITGKMFGYGLYFADKCRKSVNYTSLDGSYWARGTQKRGFLALYDVHVGHQYKIKKHKPWCYDLTEQKLKAKGPQYDSLFAKGGADLINNEYIVYNQAQTTIRYLVEIGNAE